ncbi:MAG TPA: type II toxin-antitoxin system VapC family toxin [Candidatus Dormibacteraeota bacterium]|nr:type II toxin-antitoxin system VapC family toxin [Candidatus Dormibacteraeota bacterium]
MRRYVLDANALLVHFANRPGANRVGALFEEALRQQATLSMSAVNWGEAFYSLWKQGGEATARRLARETETLPLVILAADRDRATRAAELKATQGLGYADSFAAALALELAATLVTSDPEFTKIGKRLKVLALPRHKH